MRVCAILGIFLWPLLSSGQQPLERVDWKLCHFERLLRQYQATDDVVASSSGLAKFVSIIEERKTAFKSDLSFLHYLFYKTHNRFLKHYEEYAPFNELLSRGNYNCLTGTALYALLLDRLGYDFSIVETNYHIFLIVNSGTEKVLFEATDPQHGFVSNQYTVNERIHHYQQNLQARAGEKGKIHYQYRSAVYNHVTMKQLTGLLYYNLAVRAYNQQKLTASVDLLKQAVDTYTSPRIEEFSSILLLTIEESNLEVSEKQAYIRQLKYLGSRTGSNSAKF
jgi:hypothetical protein